MEQHLEVLMESRDREETEQRDIGVIRVCNGCSAVTHAVCGWRREKVYLGNAFWVWWS